MNILIYVVIFILGFVIGVLFTTINDKLTIKGKKKSKKNILKILFELLIGAVFSGYAWGLGINSSNIWSFKLIEFFLGVLFIVFLFLIAIVDIKKNKIDKRIMIFGLVISLLNIIYHYFTVENFNINRIIIYLVLIAILTIISTHRLRKKAKNDYEYSVVILCCIINFFTYEIGTILSIIFALLIIGIKSIINKNSKKKKGKNNKEKLPIASYICISNLLVWIGIFLMQVI